MGRDAVSSTNRGAQRHPDDWYRTPAWAVAALIPELHFETATPRTVLDPCAGDGAILDVLGSRCLAYGIELDGERAIACHSGGRPCVVADALAMSSWVHPETGERPNRIVMNPPFSLAMEFVERALREVGPFGIVAVLLRLAWLSSAKRAPFHRAHPSRVLVLPRRPSFTDNGKTDSADYGWFLFGRDPGTWAVLDVHGVAS